MATTEDEDRNLGERSGDAKQDYLRIASILQERLRDLTAGTGGGDFPLTEILDIAAQEFGVGRDESSDSVERRCIHSCSDHKEPMDPHLWETHPWEVFQIVFAHLSLDEISCLKFLSKEWRQIVSSADFHQVCSDVYSKMICLIFKDVHNLFWVRVLDHLRKWHTLQTSCLPVHVIHVIWMIGLRIRMSGRGCMSHVKIKDWCVLSPTGFGVQTRRKCGRASFSML